MSDASARWARVSEGFTNRLEEVPPGSWTNPSPCTEWTAHEVAKHVVETTRTVLTRLTGGDPTAPDSDEDLITAWRVEAAAVSAALADPERAGTQVQAMNGQQPWSDLVGTLLCADTLIHTWDLARATGQDEALDAEAMQSTRAFLEPNDALLRRPGGFAPALPVPEGADAQTSFLAFVGRSSSA